MKGKLKFIIPVIIVVVILGKGFITNLSINSKKPSFENAQELDWEKVYLENSENPNRAEVYEDQWYKYTAIVQEIDKEKCIITDVILLGQYVYGLRVHFDNDDVLKDLNKGDTITVLGYLDNIGSMDSKMIHTELIENKGKITNDQIKLRLLEK